MSVQLDLTDFTPKQVHPLDERFFAGRSADGEEITANSYYLTKNGQPFFGVSGEFHFSRMAPERWEDELIKCKLCGLNTIATYVFWIHHEEEEGHFRFDGCRDIRRFVELCGKHGLYVILRVGPFDHGEVRNGGYPDWLYGKPFDTRALSEGYLACVRTLYTQIAEQVQGLFFQDNGPIIGVQIDNEYMHSAAPWERTTGISDEWVPGGHEGNAYMLALRDLARECGLTPVFYTCTGWGGAATPEEMLPLWGGYAFRPWIFYSHKGEHPATDEYHYRDYHNNTMKDVGDFQPAYPPEERPYACCEMGGGMMCCYYYRFQYPFRSVDAMANIKLASGCNFLGYYMFQGGTNPVGLNGLPMNEGQVTKRSYDYQAALGEFGQVRESYRRLKAMHYFVTSFADRLCGMKTVLPDGQLTIDPRDDATLRYCVRTDGRSGFLFINNYQDHFTLSDKKDQEVRLQLPDGETLTFAFDIASDENAILPFHFDMEGMTLLTATAQPVRRISPAGAGEVSYVFLAPDGMRPTFRFAENVEIAGHTGAHEITCQALDVTTGAAAALTDFTISDGQHRARVLVLNRAMANRMFLVRDERLVFTDAALLEDADGKLRVESTEPETNVWIYPAGTAGWNGSAGSVPSAFPQLDAYVLRVQERQAAPVVNKVGETRWTVTVPADLLQALQERRSGQTAGTLKDVRLQIDYQGDIGSLFLADGMLISDNFCNGATWEYGLADAAAALLSQETPTLTLYITPIREGANVNVESAMAGRVEETTGNIVRLTDIRLQPVYEV
ncbi:MAG: beta-galactosidase [Butyrivibrio sp.]|nr:beta-galactosidase [Butyrivibrio sp.]